MKKRLREDNQPFAYCKVTIRILQTCYSYSFIFLPQAFPTPSEHLPNPILKVCFITLHTDKRKGGNHLRDYLLYTFLVG